MSTERERVEAAITALSQQRGTLGDEIVETALRPLRAQLATLSAPEQSLRQVTILFLDVVGSTSISQHLDPEDIHALMDGALKRCTAIVDAHGGKVLQYAGDNLLAGFGIARAHEDDAEHAVRAGLALLAEGRRLGDSVLAEHGQAGFDVRVGIHTGSVLLGGGVDGDATIRGIAVNVAARLEQTAPAGTLRISRDTHRQVRELFVVEAQAPLQVKGIDEPVASYLVRGVRADPADADGGRDPGESPMVGRDADLACLLEICTSVRRVRSGRLITVTGEAGVGKSRLLAELDRVLKEEPGGDGARTRRFRSRARSHVSGAVHGVARDLLSRHGGILDSDTPDVARAKLIASFGAAFEGREAEQSAIVGQLIGLDFSADPNVAGILHDGNQIRARAFHAIGQFLRRQASGVDLLVLTIDDLHSADDASLDLIEYVAAAITDSPLVILCSARPSLLDRRSTWGSGPTAVHLALEPLPATACNSLADALLARLATPAPELHSLLTESAEGNPFHMEELAATLIDQGVIVSTPDGWRVDRSRLGKAGVPTTLTAVLQSRLDALPVAERTAMQRGSVIGHVFWDRALEAVAPGDLQTLDALTNRDLIDEHTVSAFTATREYAFRHHLLHQVTYETVLKAARRDLHRLAADWLVSMAGERVGEHLGLIAHHCERAGDAARAAEFLGRAALTAFSAGAYGDALGYANQALSLLPPHDPRERCEALLRRADIYNATGRRKEQEADIVAAAACAEQCGDDRLLVQTHFQQGMIATITGRYADAVQWCLRSETLAESIGDFAGQAASLLHRAQALVYQSNDAAAADCLEKALVVLDLASEAPTSPKRLLALNRLQFLASRRGDPSAARSLLRRAINAAREARNRRFEGGLIGNLGTLQLSIGHIDDALACAQTGLDIAREIGDRGSEPYALDTLALIALERGDAVQGLKLAREGRTIARDVSDSGAEASLALVEGKCHRALGAADLALVCFDDHDAWAAEAAIPPAARRTAPQRAMLALEQGQLVTAQSITAAMLDWLDSHGSDRTIDVEWWFVCHRVLTAVGHPRAHETLQRAHALLERLTAALDADDRDDFRGNLWLSRRIDQACVAAQSVIG